MQELSYKSGEVSSAPNSFDPIPRATVAKGTLTIKKPEEKEKSAEPKIKPEKDVLDILKEAVAETAVGDKKPVKKKKATAETTEEPKIEENPVN